MFLSKLHTAQASPEGPKELLLAYPSSLVSGDVLSSPDLSTFLMIGPYSPVILSRPCHPHASTSSLLFFLEFIADFHGNIEELGHTSVQADGFAFVEVGFSVVCWYAFLGTRFVESAIDVSACLLRSTAVFMLPWNLGGRYRLTMPEIISSSDSAAAIFSAEEGCGRPPNMNDMVRDN